MSYQVLARKWRPKKFSDVVGQDHILMAIRNSFSLKKVHHAYLLSGTRGIGKTTIARLFAKFLNCQSRVDYDACGNCEICLEIEKGCFLDVIEIDAASRTKIEDTKEFLDDMYYAPNVGKFKIYLIDEVHMLSRNSLNALLKTLEEPPRNVKFFLITTEQKKIPLTILSRCVQFFLRSLSLSQIFKQLVYIFKKENIEFEFNAVELIAYFAKGSMRDALNLSEQVIILGKNKISCNILEKVLGIINIEHALFLLENLINSNMNKVMFRINECAKLDVNWDYLLLDLLSLLQKIAIIQISHIKNEDICDEYQRSRLDILSKLVSPSNIQLYYNIFLSGRKELSYAPTDRMGFEMIMIRASLLLHDSIKNDNHFLLNKEIDKNQDSDKKVNILDIISNQGTFTSSY